MENLGLIYAGWIHRSSVSGGQWVRDGNCEPGNMGLNLSSTMNSVGRQVTILIFSQLLPLICKRDTDWYIELNCKNQWNKLLHIEYVKHSKVLLLSKCIIKESNYLIKAHIAWLKDILHNPDTRHWTILILGSVNYWLQILLKFYTCCTSKRKNKNY